MRRSTLSIAIVLTAVLIVPGSATAQPTPLDPADVQVNTYTTGTQEHPKIAVDTEGNFVVAWDSPGSSGSDSSGDSIQARRFGADGLPLGADVQVNTYTTSSQGFPAVAIDTEGNFVVAWNSAGSSGSDNSTFSVQARRFGADGVPIGGDFQVNSYTTGTQGVPEVAMDTEGNFVVAWNSAGSSGSDNSGDSIQARRFGADGVPVGDDFQVNTFTMNTQRTPAVAIGTGGDLVVAWSSKGSSGSDTDSESIQARRFGADGVPIGGDFQVNTYTTGYQSYPSVAVDPEGNFVVTWQSFGSSGSDTNGHSIQARQFSADGVPGGVDVQVNTYTTNSQRNPAVAIDTEGNFVVAWSGGSNGSDTSNYSIQARRFGADGAPVGGDFQVNTYTTSTQRGAAVAVDPEGNFVVTWQSFGSSGSDTDPSIQARRFGRPTIVVNSTSGGTGGPSCKLRDAVTAAATGLTTGGCPAGNQGANIVLPADATITLTAADNGVNGLPLVERPVTLEGNGARIERSAGLGCPGASPFRLFEVTAGAILTLENVTLANGCASGAGGGAITSDGTVVLRGSTIENNTASGGGGGLASTGNILALDATLRGNVDSDVGGGLAVGGAAPFTLLRRSTVSGNSASSGGGLLLNGRALLHNVTVSGNSATSRGGGVVVSGSDARVTVTTSTLAGNSAPTGAGLDLQVGETRLHDSLVGDNVGPDCDGISGILEATGANLDTDGSCDALTIGPLDSVASLLLGPLSDNGGPTHTHPPLAGSPAIDAAPACLTAAGAPLVVDQRGFSRPFDENGLARCDLGSVEDRPFSDGFETGDTSRWSNTTR